MYVEKLIMLEFVKCVYSQQFTRVFMYKHNKINSITLLLLGLKWSLSMPLSLQL